MNIKKKKNPPHVNTYQRVCIAWSRLCPASIGWPKGRRTTSADRLRSTWHSSRERCANWTARRRRSGWKRGILSTGRCRPEWRSISSCLWCPRPTAVGRRLRTRTLPTGSLGRPPLCSVPDSNWRPAHASRWCRIRRGCRRRTIYNRRRRPTFSCSRIPDARNTATARSQFVLRCRSRPRGRTAASGTALRSSGTRCTENTKSSIMRRVFLRKLRDESKKKKKTYISFFLRISSLFDTTMYLLRW